MRNASRGYFRVHINQGNAATVQLILEQATSVAGANAKAFANPGRIWANLNTQAGAPSGDLTVRQADAVSFTTDAGVTAKQVWLEVDPANLDVTGGFSFIRVRTGASNAANITEAELLLTELRYKGATIPTALA